MAIIKRIFGFVINRFVLTSIIFSVWIFGFGPNNLMVQHRLEKKFEEVDTEKKFYLEEIEKNQKISQDLMTNMDNLERFAREKYWMKRDNEDVYLVLQEGAAIRTKKQ